MSILIEFQRQPPVNTADAAELLANALLKPLRLACGKIVEISHLLPNAYTIKKIQTLVSQIFFALIAFLLFPVTLLGVFLATLSKSHQGMYQNFLNSRQPVIPTSILPPQTEPLEFTFDLPKRYSAWVQQKATFPLPDSLITDLMREAIALYGSQSLEQHLFSLEHEEKVRDRIAQFEKITSNRETPSTLAHEKLPKDENPIPLIVSLQQHIEQCEAKPLKAIHRHLSAISHIQDQMREQINAEELRNLEALLISEVGPDLAREILQDWDYIGTDIRDNTALLSSERKEKILAQARLAHQCQDQLHEILTQLKIDLAKDLPPQETFIFQRYANLPSLLAVMPRSKIEILHQMMARAVLNWEIRNPTAFVANSNEKRVVNALGFSIEPYEEREKIHSLVTELLNPLLQDTKIPSVEKLKQTIEDTACHTRLNAAGVPPEKIIPVRSIISSYVDTKKAWNFLTDESANSLQENIPVELPRAKEEIVASIRNKNHTSVLSLLKHQLNTYKKELLAFSAEEQADLLAFWQEKIATAENEKKLIKRCTDIDQFKKMICWFDKYQNLFIHEFAQGENDPGEALETGVCYALVYRLARATALYPELPVEELKIDTILPADRLLQAAARINLARGNSYFTIPPSISNKQRMKEIPLFRASGRANIIAGIVDQIGNLKQSNGGLILGRDNHGTFMCLDDQHNRFFFFDPNFGTLAFEQHPEENLDELVVRMALCYEELYEWAYNPDEALIGRRLVPMAPQEKLPAPYTEEFFAKLKRYE